MLGIFKWEFLMVHHGLDSTSHNLETELGFVKTISVAEVGHNCSLNHTNNLLNFSSIFSSLIDCYLHEGLNFFEYAIQILLVGN